MKRWLVLCLALGACGTGEGEGWVRSDRLYAGGCWNGPFDLKPTFFAANSFRGESLLIRVQRGDNVQEVSDGVLLLVSDLPALRGESGEAPLLGSDIPLGLPPGVQPPGALPDPSAVPPLVSLALYLHDTCHVQNTTVYALSGTINFKSVFSGDVNEPLAHERLTEASFTAQFADPRDLTAGSRKDPEQVTSTVSGYLRFYFQRGQPAQPFP
jgi:hypothetical protein